MNKHNDALVKIKPYIKKYGVFYTIGFVIAFAMKYYYSKADIDGLDWILAPTVRWVQLLSGIVFEKRQNIGYVNHNYRFVIAPVCAGINFMIIAFLSLVFSFIHRMGTLKGRIIWMAACIAIVYPYTILVNSLRIIPSIFLLQMDIYNEWITAERLHTIEGTAVYFASLLTLYLLTGRALRRLIPIPGSGRRKDAHSGQPIKMVYGYTIPVLLYFFITLGIPFVNGALSNNRAGFLEYAVLVIVVCSVVIILFRMAITLRKSISKSDKMADQR